MHQYMAKVLTNASNSVCAINSVEDHVHILLKLARTSSPASVAEEVKKSSSKWLKTQLISLANFQWQTGYAAFSVSESNVKCVKDYIARQEEHHQKLSFKQEFVSFLKKNKIEYDDRYLWE